MNNLDWAADRGETWLAQIDKLEKMLDPIDEPLLSAVELKSSTKLRIADIACGAGGTTLKLENIAPHGCVVHGLDISASLISFAISRTRNHNSNAQFYVQDLQAQQPETEQYDVLISRFGTMFFDNPKLAFNNIKRLLKPNGQFAFAVWGDPIRNPWMNFLREIVHQYVGLPETEPNTPGPFRYAELEFLITVLQETGFKQIVVHDWQGSLELGGGLNAESAADFAINAFSVGGPLLKANKPILSEARQALVKKYNDNKRDGKVQMDAYVHIISGKA